MRSFDAKSAECFVFTFKEGLLSKVAHDLKIAVRKFTIDIADDASSVSGRFDTSSLEVVAAMRDGQEDLSALSGGDRQKIHTSIAEEVFGPKLRGDAVFTSRRVEKRGESYRIDGDLTLGATTRPLSLDAVRDGGMRSVEARIFQPDFGIKPFSAMLGALKIKPELLVRVRVPFE